MKKAIKIQLQLTLFSLLAIILLTTCTKGKGNIYAEGRVYNPITGEGHSGIEMKLIRTNAINGDLFEGSNRKHEQTVITDENGNFVIEHIGNLFGTYILQPRDPSGTYVNVTWDQYKSALDGERPIKPKEELYDNFQMVGLGVTNFYLKNVNCVNEFDSLHYERTYLLTNKNYANNFYWTGCLNSDGNYTGSGEGDYKVDWYVIRNGVRTDSSTFFTVHEGQTTNVDIFY